MVFERGTCKILSLGRKEHATVPSLRNAYVSRMIGTVRVALACFQPRGGSHFQNWGVCHELAVRLGPRGAGVCG